MVETRHQSASNEENLRFLELLEEGEVSPTPTLHQSEETILEAVSSFLEDVESCRDEGK